MIEKIAEQLFRHVYLPRARRTESEIGYRLVFHHIPERYINGYVSWDMTKQFKKAGLNIEAGADYWTMGKIVNGVSTRFDRSAPEYQSWLGGYTVKIPPQGSWSVKDHFKLAIVDQNDWLGMYGDPNPMTTVEDHQFPQLGDIHLGPYSGTLYELGCTTHSDVGPGDRSFKLGMELPVIASLLNFSNPNMKLKGSMFTPKTVKGSYEILKLIGYIAIFNVEQNVKVILYGNGAIVPNESGETNTFLALKDDILKAMQSCEIVKVQ